MCEEGNRDGINHCMRRGKDTIVIYELSAYNHIHMMCSLTRTHDIRSSMPMHVTTMCSAHDDAVPRRGSAQSIGLPSRISHCRARLQCTPFMHIYMERILTSAHVPIDESTIGHAGIGFVHEQHVRNALSRLRDRMHMHTATAWSHHG